MSTAQAIIPTSIGKVLIVEQNNKIIHTRYLLDEGDLQTPTTSLLKETAKQILAYLKNPNTVFDLPIELIGTELQQKIWRALTKIPLGKTLSYGELAKKIKTSPRVIGNACRRNPVPIIIPCHRIIAQNGIGGFAGQTSGGLIDVKQWLLIHENVILKRRES